MKEEEGNMEGKRVVLHLLRSEDGGAGQYSMNIHHLMLELGYRSYVCVNDQRLLCPNGKEIPIAKHHRLFLWNKFRRSVFRKVVECWGHVDAKYLGFNLSERFLCHSYKDVLDAIPEVPTDIMVHWVSGYANSKYVRDLQQATRAKTYYWMIDEAPLSGACHYPWDCEQYQSGCKDCPMTDAKLVKRSIEKNFLYKEKYLVPGRRLVLPTEMDRIRAERSLLWKGIPNLKLIEIVDEYDFCPSDDMEKLREFFKIPHGKRVVLFGSGDIKEERKGIATLMKAIAMIDRDDMVYLVAGRKSDWLAATNLISLGYVDIPTLIKAYQVSDVFVCSSLEDSGPQMINQSIMCGTPVVAFKMGVAIDIVKTGETGYLAKWNDAEDMAHGINYILDLNQKDYQRMSVECRSMALETYSKRVFGGLIKKLFLNDYSF